MYVDYVSTTCSPIDTFSSFYRIYRLLRYFYCVLGNRTDIFMMVIKRYPSSTTSNVIASLLQLGKFEIPCHRFPHTKTWKLKIHYFPLERIKNRRRGGYIEKSSRLDTSTGFRQISFASIDPLSFCNFILSLSFSLSYSLSYSSASNRIRWKPPFVCEYACKYASRSPPIVIEIQRMH